MNISIPGAHLPGKLNRGSGSKSSQSMTWTNKILKKLPPNARGHIVACIGEFAGTIFFLFFAFAGTQVANISSNENTGTTIVTTVQQKNPAQLLYISLAFGFSLAVNAWIYFRISGGLFNPAVTFGMWLIGAINTFRAILLTVVQCLGAIIAAALVSVLFAGGLNVSTTLSSTTTLAQGFFIEMILTAQLVFAIFMLAAEKHAATFIAPVGIGLTLFVAELTGVFWTGGSLNPARSLGPAVVVKSFPSSFWIYWIAPLVGAGLAALLYKLIKNLEYETANPVDPEVVRPLTSVTTTSAAPAGSDNGTATLSSDNGKGHHGHSGHRDSIEIEPKTNSYNNHHNTIDTEPKMNNYNSHHNPAETELRSNNYNDLHNTTGTATEPRLNNYSGQNNPGEANIRSNDYTGYHNTTAADPKTNNYQ